MFELLTETARRALFDARENAWNDGAEFIEGHHLLMALLASNEPSAIDMLGRLGASPETLRKSLPEISGRPPGPRRREIPFSTVLKSALRVACAEAERSPQPQMGGKEFLIGLFVTEGCLPPSVVESYNYTLADLRAAAATSQRP